MERVGRWCEIAVGLFFLVSAAAKAYDVDSFRVIIMAYGVVKDASVVKFIAYGSIFLEAGLGAFLLSAIRFKGASHAATAGLTLAFSGLVFYAWRWNGLTDCGCLGTWLVLDPPATLAKNAVLLAALGAGWHGTRNLASEREAARTESAKPRYFAAMSVVAIIVLLLLDPGGLREGTPVVIAADADPDRPLSKFVFEADGQAFDLGEGEYLIAMLNATCGHCQASVEGLNEFLLNAELPEMVGLISGTAQEIEEFQLFQEPLFPLRQTSMIDLIEFMNSPPALVYARDGAVIETWTWVDDVPPIERIFDAVLKARAG